MRLRDTCPLIWLRQPCRLMSLRETCHHISLWEPRPAHHSFTEKKGRNETVSASFPPFLSSFFSDFLNSSLLSGNAVRFFAKQYAFPHCSLFFCKTVCFPAMLHVFFAKQYDFPQCCTFFCKTVFFPQCCTSSSDCGMYCLTAEDQILKNNNAYTPAEARFAAGTPLFVFKSSRNTLLTP